MPCENAGKGGRMQLWSRSGGSVTSEDGPQREHASHPHHSSLPSPGGERERDRERMRGRPERLFALPVCLDGPNLCLTHKPGEPVLVRGRESPYQPGQDWRGTGHSLDFPGELLRTLHDVNHDSCIAACTADAECKAVHYDAETKSCALHAESVCLTAEPPR